MKIPKFFWTSDEGKWIARDKICHVVLHFGIVIGYRFLGADLILAFLISQAWGWFYEWLWDCNLVALFTDKAYGASKKDIICNNLGAIIGMVI